MSESQSDLDVLVVEAVRKIREIVACPWESEFPDPLMDVVKRAIVFGATGKKVLYDELRNVRVEKLWATYEDMCIAEIQHYGGIPWLSAEQIKFREAVAEFLLSQ